jgi:tRNA pseudouridine38-40 synthase
VERALTQLGQPKITVTGSGRTDAGVHATGQVIAFNAEWRHGLDDLQRALNATLPADMAVLDLQEAAADFHPRYDAVSREYVYTIYDAPVRHPLERLYALHVAGPLDVMSMNAAAATLVGEHDFAAFGNPTTGEVTVRRMWRAQVSAAPPLVRVELEANGFLTDGAQHCRNLLAVGRGWHDVDEFRGVLESRDRSRAGRERPHRLVPDTRELLIES